MNSVFVATPAHTLRTQTSIPWVFQEEWRPALPDSLCCMGWRSLQFVCWTRLHRRAMHCHTCSLFQIRVQPPSLWLGQQEARLSVTGKRKYVAQRVPLLLPMRMLLAKQRTDEVCSGPLVCLSAGTDLATRAPVRDCKLLCCTNGAVRKKCWTLQADRCIRLPQSIYESEARG